MAGAGQFGRPDQGIFSFWINSHLRRKPLRYIGFDGMGHQVRDCLHPRDLVALLVQQTQAAVDVNRPSVTNLSGGITSATSLRQLSDWCDSKFGKHSVASDPSPRKYDLPWVVLDHQLATNSWGWLPQTSIEQILNEIAEHAIDHPNWLELSGC
jgi:CDP-paratose 2-epimerase